MSDIWTDNPTVMCYAYDAYPRRLAMFTGAARLHPASRRWTPVGDSVRIDGPLETHTADSTSGDLQIRPGKEEFINGILANAPKFVAGVGAVGTGQRIDQPTIVGQH
jgi:hypothetical protein